MTFSIDSFSNTASFDMHEVSCQGRSGFSLWISPSNWCSDAAGGHACRLMPTG